MARVGSLFLSRAAVALGLFRAAAAFQAAPGAPAARSVGGLDPRMPLRAGVARATTMLPQMDYLTTLKAPLDLAPVAPDALERETVALAMRPQRTVLSYLGEPELDPYELLDVARNATVAEVRRSYHGRVRAWRCHPDMGGGPLEAAMFQKLAEAMAILGDDDKRKAYDLRRRTKAAVERIILVAEKTAVFMIAEVAPVAVAVTIVVGQGLGRSLRRLWRRSKVAVENRIPRPSIAAAKASRPTNGCI